MPSVLAAESLWLFGYGSLTWKAAYPYTKKQLCCLKGYERVWYQGSTDHRGVPEKPGRTVTLRENPDSVTWGVAYCLCGEESKEGGDGGNEGKDKEQSARDLTRIRDELDYREKQYDLRAELPVFAHPTDEHPLVDKVLVYIATANKELNPNYLGPPASLSALADQIATAVGPSGPNKEYLFELAKTMRYVSTVLLSSFLLSFCLIYLFLVHGHV